MSEKLKIVVDDKGKVKIWMDGKEAFGVRRIKFECDYPETPTHEIEVYSHIFKLGDKDE